MRYDVMVEILTRECLRDVRAQAFWLSGVVDPGVADTSVWTDGPVCSTAGRVVPRVSILSACNTPSGLGLGFVLLCNLNPKFTS